MSDLLLLLRVFDGNVRRAEVVQPAGDENVLEAEGWRLAFSLAPTPESFDLTVRVLGQGAGGVCVGVARDVPAGAHLAIPAAVYDGNRFRRLPLRYPCMLEDPADFVPDLPTTVSWIPALPHVQLLAGDASIPAIGVLEAGFWWQAPARTGWGDTGLEAIEGEELRVALLFPGVREGLVYDATPDWRPSPDRAPCPVAGEELSIRIDRATFEGRAPRDLYAALFDLRKRGLPEGGSPELPFSAAWDLLERKHNDVYWNEELGYYMLSDGRWEYGQWQAGWVGGGIQSFALAFSDASETQARVARMLDFIVGPAQNDSGLFWSFCIDGRMDTDMVGMSYGHDWHLVRRTGDVLYFLLKTIDLWRRQGREVKESWRAGARRAADALASIWERQGRFGQFVSQFTGEIRSGDTTNGGIIPAALVLAAREFAAGRYLTIAQTSAEKLVERYLDRGYTNGGPGEAVQAPDSESAFGLLESLVELHEATGDPRWRDDAEACAHLAASWVMPYDFAFPPESTMGRLDMRTTGSVWANLQNKHSAPGICTLSGVSLLKLYRATGNEAYLELLRDIAHGVTQYLSRADRPVFDLLPGGSCERVNTSDWEGDRIPVGEGFNVDCWCSISAMLTCQEIPGLYINPATGVVRAIDHIEVERQSHTILLTNRTPFDSEVRVFVDDGRPVLGSGFLWGCPVVRVPAEGTATYGAAV